MVTGARCVERRWSVDRSQCGYRARWWVETPHSSTSAIEVCGHHARAYLVRWPRLTSDPVADRAIAEGVFV